MKNMANDEKNIKIHKILGDVIGKDGETEIKKLKGDLVQGNKYLIKNGKEAPPQDHPNGRDCPQCEGWTWKRTRECVHCGYDIFTMDYEADLKRQEEIQEQLRKQRELEVIEELKKQNKKEPQTLWDVSSNELFKEHEHCKKQKWEVYSKRFLPFSVAICGFVISIYLLIDFVIPNMFGLKTAEWYLVYGIIFFSLIPSTIWVNKVRSRDDKLIAYYKERIEIITHILRVRGDL
ncbi:hypothetical protein [Acinetobacter pittii]|uniref:hypothetical protein n=1 Tax=Acinetobacter pittii TaxID=48296 RepID=UPI0005CAAED5|nr:hypothetical protein [Acinetobacter pittii]MDP7811619.1 hypothetical protein [Acinetobacter pittii]